MSIRDLTLGFILLWALSQLACAKIPHKIEGRDCEHLASAEDIQYPDGTIKKSEVIQCTYESGSTCIYASWVNDDSVKFTNCP